MQLEKCIFYQLTRASQNSTHFFQAQIQTLGLTPVQAMVITALNNSDDTTFSQLGKKLRVTGPTLTGVVDRLEDAGFVKRRADTSDRRSTRIKLTDKGLDMCARLDVVSKTANTDFLNTLSPGEQGLLRLMLDRLIDVPKPVAKKE